MASLKLLEGFKDLRNGKHISLSCHITRKNSVANLGSRYLVTHTWSRQGLSKVEKPPQTIVRKQSRLLPITSICRPVGYPDIKS
jgi:hypothetical protein